MEQDDYIVVNAKLAYRWKHISTFLNVNNVFNEEYDEYGVIGGNPIEASYYPSPKANFMIGVTMDL